MKIVDMKGLTVTVPEDIECTSIRVEVSGKVYRLTEEHGQMVVSCVDGSLAVYPAYANAIRVEEK